MGYYSKYNRLGDKVLVSGVDVFDAYFADLVNMKPLAGTISASYAKKTGLSSFALYHHDIPLRTLEMQFYVGGDTAEDAERNVSGLLAAVTDCVITTDRTRFEYPAVLTAYTDIDSEVDNYHTVTLKLAALRRLPLVTQTLASTGSVTNEGTAESGMRLELVFGSAQSSALVNGIQIKNVPAGVPFVIDGIEGVVTCNGDNRLGDTNLYKFPKMKPGANTITLPAGCTCKVSYYPTFT